jgi:MFS family permease
MSDPSATDSTERTPLLGYTGWLLAASGFFYAWILRVSPSVMVGDLMAEFQIGGAVLGVMSSLYFYTYAAIQVPVGLAVDRFGPRRILSFTILITALGCVVSAAAPTIEVVYVGRLMIGFGSAFALVGSMVVGALWFPPRRFALLAGLAVAIGLVGGAVGQWALAWAVPEFGWRDTMYGIGAGGVVLSALTWLLTRDRPPGKPRVATPSIQRNRARSVAADVWRVAQERQIVWASIITALSSAPVLTFGALWGVSYSETVYGMSRPEAAFYVSFLLYGVALGGPIFGWLSDRIGRRKTPLIVGQSMACISFATMLYVPDLPPAVFGLLIGIAGFGGASMNLCYATGRESLPTRNIGAALGLINMTAVALGGIVIQPLVGWFLDLQWTGELKDGARVYSAEAFQLALIVVPGLSLMAVLSCFGLRETYCQPVVEEAAA